MSDVLISIVPNSGQPGVCKGCKRQIIWMDTLNGKRMPMNAHALPHHKGDVVDMYAASDSHWATCSARAMFDKRSRANA